ncbi:hypothetical protein ACX8XN_18550 [Calditrichota bacterium GD2]
MNSNLKSLLRQLDNPQNQDNGRFHHLVKLKHIVIINDYEIIMDGKRSPYSFHHKGRPCAIVIKEEQYATFVPRTTTRKYRKRNQENDPYAFFVPKNIILGLDKDGWFLIRYLQSEDEAFFNEHAYKCGALIPDDIFEKLLNKLDEWIEKNFRDVYE